jgi:hypothetical protein
MVLVLIDLSQNYHLVADTGLESLLQKAILGYGHYG